MDVYGTLSTPGGSAGKDKEAGSSATSPTSSFTSVSSSTTHAAIGVALSTYSLLVGVHLICYDSLVSLDRGSHPMASYILVGASAVSQDATSFRVVTNQGTHLLCSAPTSSCRDVWLSALNAGLEARVKAVTSNNGSGSHTSDENDSNNSLQLTKPRAKVRGSILRKTQRYCHSCGKLERLEYPLSINQSPLPQYGVEERVDLCLNCDTAQGVVEHCTWVEELYETRIQELQALLEARRVLVEKLQGSSTGVATTDDEGSAPNEEDGNDQAKAIAGEKDEKAGDDSTTESSHSEPLRDEKGRLLPISHKLQLKPLSHNLIEQVLQSPEGLTLKRLSPTLKNLCSEFEQGMIGVLEFMELLEHAIGIRDPAMAELKKQAFRVAGDMGTALKLLYEQCLPPKTAPDGSNSNPLDGTSSHHRSGFDPHDANNSTELLQCILEFYLDLCEEGTELPTLAFFWPQISNIHLQMLPPTDAASLQRVELMEDFLLTVASKFSIHLAIELVWSHTADLEDSRTLPYCAKRQFAVLRFLCELESLLFDFDGGWGGGSVTVGQFLSPSNHQIDLLKSSMGRIQTYRLSEQDRLSKSHRLYKIQLSKGDGEPPPNVPPEVLAREALRVAKNADYMSTHMAFTKRLCDIAEKLRFLPVEDRKSSLQIELSKLNSSGTMGGDPLNKVTGKDNDHTRVVRIPLAEGHVFRSKERTPVLLLVETLDEGAEQKLKSEMSFSNEGHEDATTDDPALDLVVSKSDQETATTTLENGDAEGKHTESTSGPTAVEADVLTEEKDDKAGGYQGNSEEENDEVPEDSEAGAAGANVEVKTHDRMTSTPTPKTVTMGLNDIPEFGTPRNSTVHKRLGSMQSTHSETSISLAGSQDGLHDAFEAAQRRMYNLA